MRKLHGTYTEDYGGSYRTQDEKPGSIGGNVVEADPSVKPPEKWFKMMSNDIKKKNPSYSDDQVQKTIGDIWYHKLSTAKKQEIRGREGKEFGPAESVNESSDKKISDYQIVDHGMENSSYFQGHGVSRSKWDDTRTGVGSSVSEAIENAATQLAEDGWEISKELDSEIEKIKKEHGDESVGTDITVIAHIVNGKVEDFHIADASATLISDDEQNEDVDVDLKDKTGQIQLSAKTLDIGPVANVMIDACESNDIEIPSEALNDLEKKIQRLQDNNEHYYYISIDVKGEDHVDGDEPLTPFFVKTQKEDVTEAKKAPFKVGDKVTFKKDAKYFKDYIGKELTVSEVIPPIKAWGESPLNKKQAAEPYYGIKLAEIPEVHLLKDFSIQKVNESSEEFKTLYVKKEFANNDVGLISLANEIEKAIKRDVAVVGSGGINIYTQDQKLIDKAIKIMGDKFSKDETEHYPSISKTLGIKEAAIIVKTNRNDSIQASKDGTWVEPYDVKEKDGKSFWNDKEVQIVDQDKDGFVKVKFIKSEDQDITNVPGEGCKNYDDSTDQCMDEEISGYDLNDLERFYQKMNHLVVKMIKSDDSQALKDLLVKITDAGTIIEKLQIDAENISHSEGEWKKHIGGTWGSGSNFMEILVKKLPSGKYTYKINAQKGYDKKDSKEIFDGTKDEKYHYDRPRQASDAAMKNRSAHLKDAGMMENLEKKVGDKQMKEDKSKKGLVEDKMRDEANKLLKMFLSKKDKKSVLKNVTGELPEISIGDVSFMYGNAELLAYTDKNTFVWKVDDYGNDKITFELFSVTDLDGKEVEESVMKEDKNPISDYEVTVEIPVEEAAEMVSKKGDLKKALDLDYMELSGYDVDPTKHNLPKGFDGADIYFPTAVKQAIYSADEQAALAAYHKAAIDAVVERFEKVEPTDMEYTGDTSKGEQSFVSAVAGVTSAHYDKDSGKVVVTIKNPHHLINGIISGVGFFGVDLPIDEKIDAKETMDRLHNIVDYYEVWGERMPQIDDRAGDNASWDDDFMKEELKFRIGETSEADLIDDLMNVDDIDMDKLLKIEGNPFKKKELQKILDKVARMKAKKSSHAKELSDIKDEEKQLKEDGIGDDPAVYVGTYGKYNDGSIDGAWVSLNKYPTKDEFYEHIKELHKDEEDPEFMFQDYQNFPEKYYHESGLDDGIWDWLALDEDDRKLLEAYIEATGDENASIDDAKDKFQGKYDSKEDWAQQFIDETGGLSGDNASYYLSISDLDARLIAGEEADSQAEDMRYSLKKEDYDEVFDRTEKFQDEYEKLKEELEAAEDDEDADEDSIKKKIEELAEKAIEDWASEYSDEVEEKIKDDVVGYFVDEQGIYTKEELSKQSFISIDYDKYVRDTEINGDVNFVKMDGEYYVFWGH